MTYGPCWICVHWMGVMPALCTVHSTLHDALLTNHSMVCYVVYIVHCLSAGHGTVHYALDSTRDAEWLCAGVRGKARPPGHNPAFDVEVCLGHTCGWAPCRSLSDALSARPSLH